MDSDPKSAPKVARALAQPIVAPLSRAAIFPGCNTEAGGRCSRHPALVLWRFAGEFFARSIFVASKQGSRVSLGIRIGCLGQALRHTSADRAPSVPRDQVGQKPPCRFRLLLTRYFTSGLREWICASNW